MNADPAALDETPLQASRIDWPLLGRLPALLGASACSGESCRQLLAQGQQELQQRFRDDEPVEALVRARAAFIDALFVCLWRGPPGPAPAGGPPLPPVRGSGCGRLPPSPAARTIRRPS